MHVILGTNCVVMQLCSGTFSWLINFLFARVWMHGRSIHLFVGQFKLWRNFSRGNDWFVWVLMYEISLSITDGWENITYSWQCNATCTLRSNWLTRLGKAMAKEGVFWMQTILRRILGKSFWSSCVRFTLADLLKNIYILIKAILGPTLLIHICLVPESWFFLFTHDLP